MGNCIGINKTNVNLTMNDKIHMVESIHSIAMEDKTSKQCRKRLKNVYTHDIIDYNPIFRE
jgi:hypothetical protein